MRTRGLGTSSPSASPDRSDIGVLPASGRSAAPLEQIEGRRPVTSGAPIGRSESAVRVAVVGCGYWGSKHLRVLCAMAGVEVVGVDSSEHRREALARMDPWLTVVPTMEAAIDCGVDAVLIATPASTHAELAMRALAAGCHVFVEKPLTTRLADAVELCAAADRSGRVLMVGHTFEFNAAVRHMRETMRSGALGDIYYLDAARLNLGLYQPDTNVLWDLAVHDVSISNFLLERRPAAVHAWGLRQEHRRLEDVAYLRLMYLDPDVTSHVHVSWIDPSKVRRVTVVGSRRMAVYNDLNADERVRIFDKGVDAPPDGDLSVAPLSYRFGDIVSPYIEFPEPLAVEDGHFIDCVRRGERPLADGWSGAAVVAVLEAAERSLRSGQVEAVDSPTVVAAGGRVGLMVGATAEVAS